MSKELKALIRKDLVSEFRTRETVILQICLSILLSVVAAFGLGSAFLNPSQVQDLFPTFIWLIFLFSATISISRSFEYEYKERGLEGLLLTGVSPALIFLSKFLVGSLVVFFGHICALTVLSMMLNVPVMHICLQFSFLSLLLVLGYASLSTLLAAVTAGTSLKGMLLPLILLPLLFPLLFAALELTAGLFAENSIDFASGWFSILIAFDVIYIALGINLFETVVRD